MNIKSQNAKQKTVRKLALSGVALAMLSLLASACTAPASGSSTGGFDSSQIAFYAVILIGIVAYGYFLIYRPRKKQAEQQKKRIESQKPGDEIITMSGIFGVIQSIDENSVVIKIESGATMRIARQAIAGKADDLMPPTAR